MDWIKDQIPKTDKPELQILYDNLCSLTNVLTFEFYYKS